MLIKKELFIATSLIALLLGGCGESIGEAAGKAIADNINQQIDLNDTINNHAFQYIGSDGQVHTVQLNDKVPVNYNQNSTQQTTQTEVIDNNIVLLEKELDRQKQDQKAREELQKKIDELENKIQQLQEEQQKNAQNNNHSNQTPAYKTDFDMSWDYNSDKLLKSDLSKLIPMMPQPKAATESDRRQILRTIDEVFQIVNPLDTLEIKNHTGRDGIQTLIKRYDINTLFKLYLDPSVTDIMEEKHKFVIDMMQPDKYRLYLAYATGWSGTWSDFTKIDSPLNITFINPAQTDAGEYVSYDLAKHRFNSDSANEKIWKVLSFQFLIPKFNFFGTIGTADPKSYTDIFVVDILYYRDQKYDWEYRAGILSSKGKKNTPRGIEFFPHPMQFD